MSSESPVSAAIVFVERLNRRDFIGLAEIMARDHRLLPGGKKVLVGRAAACEALSGYVVLARVPDSHGGRPCDGQHRDPGGENHGLMRSPPMRRRNSNKAHLRGQGGERACRRVSLLRRGHPSAPEGTWRHLSHQDHHLGPGCGRLGKAWRSTRTSPVQRAQRHSPSAGRWALPAVWVTLCRAGPAR